MLAWTVSELQAKQFVRETQDEHVLGQASHRYAFKFAKVPKTHDESQVRVSLTPKEGLQRTETPHLRVAELAK